MILPKIFSQNKKYQYFFRDIIYIGIYEDYYKFSIINGANLLIDYNHITLIYEKRH